jgi:hypothetical protein
MSNRVEEQTDQDCAAGAIWRLRTSQMGSVLLAAWLTLTRSYMHDVVCSDIHITVSSVHIQQDMTLFHWRSLT